MTAFAATPTSASAQAHRMVPEIDIPVLALTGVVAFGWILGDELAPPHCAPECDRSTVNGLDRGAAGNWSGGWSTVGDVGVATMLGVPAIVLLAAEGPVPMLSDAVVIGQAVALSQTLAVISNMSTRRPRPFVYGTDAPLDERMRGRASLSFFSGHTAASFAAAVATWRTLLRLHPRSPWPWVALGVGLVGASVVGMARVLGGHHFPTDVMAGALTGMAMGWLIPELHGERVRIAPLVVGPSRGVGVVLDVQP